LYLQGAVLGKILIQDMVEIKVGFDRACFRTNFNKTEQDKCCFVLQATHRTLNLETDTSKECEEWVTALRYIISSYRLNNNDGNASNATVDQDGHGRTDSNYSTASYGGEYKNSRAQEGLRSDSSGSSNSALLRSLSTFWRRGKQSTGSRESAASDANSDISSSPPGVTKRNNNQTAHRHTRTMTLADTADIGSRGQLMAMEERHDVLRSELSDMHQRLRLLSQACGICCDMMWESGARDEGCEGQDVATNVATPAGTYTDDDHPLFLPPWQGGNRRGDSVKQGSDPPRGGPLAGKTPTSLNETKRLAQVMLRMSTNLVQGRGGEAALEDGDEKEKEETGVVVEEMEDETIHETDKEVLQVLEDETTPTPLVERPRARSSRASTMRSVDVYENLRKALLLKLDRAIDINRLQRKIDEQSEIIEKMEEQISHYDVLSMFVVQQQDHKQQQQEQQEQKKNASLASNNNNAFSTGRMSSMVAGNIDGWLNTLTPDLNVSWTSQQQEAQGRNRAVTGIPPGVDSTNNFEASTEDSQKRQEERSLRGSLMFDFVELSELGELSNAVDGVNAVNAANAANAANAVNAAENPVANNNSRKDNDNEKKDPNNRRSSRTASSLSNSSVGDMDEVPSDEETDEERFSGLSTLSSGAGKELADKLARSRRLSSAYTADDVSMNKQNTTKEDEKDAATSSAATPVDWKRPILKSMGTPPPPPRTKKSSKKKGPPPPPPPRVKKK
jgi:hypothetical protein